jgi:hypothetical protein
MSRREPCVCVEFRIERVPRVRIVADSDDDFQRLAFQIRSNREQHELVRAAIDLERERRLVE